MDQPWLFVDIDGVLNPYGGECPEGFGEHHLFPGDDDPIRVCAAHGEWLHELSTHYDLAWATSWSAPDRGRLATVLDLPEFHGAIDLPRDRFDPVVKLPAVDHLAGNRSLAWIDDVFAPEAWAWAAGRVGPTLLVPIDPAIGLTRAQVDQLVAWVSDPT